MTNPYYTATTGITPFSRASANQIQGEFRSIQDAFDDVSAAIGVNNNAATSISPVAIGVGNKSFVASAQRNLAAGQFVIVAVTDSITNFMLGQIVSYNPITGALVVAVNSAFGSGTYSAWTISVGPANLPGGQFLTTSIINGLGSAGAPAYAFNGDADTGMWSPGADTIALSTGGVERARIDGSGGITSSNRADAFGYKGLPLNQRTSAYTLVMSDMGKLVYTTAGAFAVTIPANSTTAFPIGTELILINEDAIKTVAPAAGVTLVQGGTAASGTRTLAIGAVATLVKVGTDRWFISGAGVS